MPLGVIQAPDQPKSFLEEAIPYVNQIMQGFKKNRQNKAEAELINIYQQDLDKAADKNKVNELIYNLTNIPEEITNPPGLQQFAENTAGLLQQKEQMLGNIPKPEMGQLQQKEILQSKNNQQVAGQAQTQIPQKDWATIYKAIDSMDIGNPDFTNTFDFIQKNFAASGMTDIVKQVLSGISQNQMSSNNQLQNNINLTDLVNGIVNPKKQEAKKPTSELGLYLTNKDVWQQYQNDKNSVKVKPTNDPAYQIYTVTDKQGNQTAYYVNKDDPDSPAIPVKDMPSGYKKPTGTGTTGTKKPPTYRDVKMLEEDLLDPNNDYDEVMANAETSWDLAGVTLPTKADHAHAGYDMFEQVVTDTDKDGNRLVVDTNGSVIDPKKYKDYYKDYSKFAETVYLETGQLLPKKYLSLEEYEKSDIKPKSWKPNTWGQQKSVKNINNIPWSFAPEEPKVGDTRVDDKGVLWKYIGDNKWQS